MKKLLYVASALMLFLVFDSCNSDDEESGLCLVGSGTVNTYPIDVDTFDEIALFGPINLRIVQGQEQDVVINAEPEMIEYITHEVKSGRLEIGIKETIRCFESEVGIRVDIVVPDIEEIFVVGVSEVTSNGDLDLDYLRIDVSGVANVTLTGSVEEQVISSAGEITVNNFDFVSNDTRITISGVGNLEVTCESTLDISVSGAATIRYKGNPEITQSSAGTLTLINAN